MYVTPPSAHTVVMVSSMTTPVVTTTVTNRCGTRRSPLRPRHMRSMDIMCNERDDTRLRGGAVTTPVCGYCGANRDRHEQRRIPHAPPPRPRAPATVDPQTGLVRRRGVGRLACTSGDCGRVEALCHVERVVGAHHAMV